MKLKDITEEDFRAYEKVRISGQTNMLDTDKVSELSGGVLTKEKILKIIRHYETLLILNSVLREILRDDNDER